MTEHGDETVAAASARAMGLDEWDVVVPLAGGRGGASRATAGGVDHVMKRYPAGDPTGGARERAALHALAGAAGTPTLLAEADEPPLVVMSHVAGHGSVADVLLGDDPQVAEEALLRWAVALAHLHAAGTPDVGDAFVERLAERGPGLEPRSLAGDFAGAAESYAVALADLDLPPHPDGLAELRALPARLGDVRDEVLSPADTCPDNNVLTADGLVLIDFEHAELRHRAWDVAYLRAPWPSCWCAWLVPEDVAARAVHRYRAAAGPVAVRPGFDADLDLATLGWQAMTPGWFLAGALESDDRDRSARGPTRRAFVLHRLAAVAATDTLPALAAMAADLHAELVRRWGEVDLELAPAFRS
ncbi:hypothetical protein [Nocardioides sp.]|uniref:hypothetical protein n=1 Tax=Nocardioides sp. TaxID=35761 RepID=UPI0035AF8851